MGPSVSKLLLAVLLALQPASMWTLLDLFGSDHAVRLAVTESGVVFVLAHDHARRDHRHGAADRLLASDHVVGAGDHAVHRLLTDLTVPGRAMTAALPGLAAQALVVSPPDVRLASGGGGAFEALAPRPFHRLL